MTSQFIIRMEVQSISCFTLNLNNFLPLTSSACCFAQTSCSTISETLFKPTRVKLPGEKALMSQGFNTTTDIPVYTECVFDMLTFEKHSVESRPLGHL